MIDFLLGVETRAHGPFVKEMEERTGFEEADGFGIRKEIESDLRGDPAIEEFTAELNMKLGNLPVAPKASDILDQRFVDAALKKLGTYQTK